MALDKSDIRRVSPDHYARLRLWSRRKPCVALMGEFSGGKSTLMNFLIEGNLLPTQVTATELPPIWFSNGTEGSYFVDQQGHVNPIHARDLNQLPMTAKFARVFVRAEILEACDVIDTPGISDPNMLSESWRVAAGFANMVLWCTTATQAWRESERSTWASLPERLRRHSLLMVTRSDKLLTETDRDKVLRRLQRETEGLFAKTVFLSTPDATRAKAELEAGAESPLWQESGAAALLDSMAERFEAIAAERIARFARYAPGSSERRPVLRLERSVVPGRPHVEVAAADHSGPVRPARPARPAALGSVRRPSLDETIARVAKLNEIALDDDLDSVVDQTGSAPPETVPEPELDAPRAPVAVVRPSLRRERPASAPDARSATEQLPGDSVAPVREPPPAPAAPEANDPPAPDPAAAAEAAEAEPDEFRIPPEVLVWRKIVAEFPDAAENRVIVAMIERLLDELYGQHQAKANTDEAAPDRDSAAKSWRRRA